jgi:hypothetical protein
METYSSETAVGFQGTIQRYIPEDRTLQIYEMTINTAGKQGTDRLAKTTHMGKVVLVLN